MILRQNQDEKKSDVYIAGSVAYDEIMDFPKQFKDYFHPEKLHQINVSFVVQDLAKHLGGIATNISYALRNTSDYLKNKQLEIYPVAAVGKDGGEIVHFFSNNNINTTYVQQDKKLYTATGKVITDKSDNQIWGFYYGASSLTPRLPPQSKPSQVPFWIVSATHEKPFTTVLNYVIKNKLPYLFDPGMTLTWISDELLKSGVMNAEYVVGNDYEIAMIEKRLKLSVKKIVGKGVNVITTLGEKGVSYYGAVIPVKTGIQSKIYNTNNSNYRLDSRLRGNDNPFSISSVKLKKVIDPTGAGDAWRGGFVGALITGWKIEECLAMGNVMASFAVESVGTVEYMVSASEIKKRIQSILNV